MGCASRGRIMPSLGHISETLTRFGLTRFKEPTMRRTCRSSYLSRILPNAANITLKISVIDHNTENKAISVV